VLSAAFEKTKDLRMTSKLIDILLYRSLADLSEFLEGTRAAAH